MTPELAKALEFFDKNIGAVNGDDVVPPGFFSAPQMAAAKGLTNSQYLKLQWDRMVEAGKAERRILKIGKTRTAYYKVKE